MPSVAQQALLSSTSLATPAVAEFLQVSVSAETTSTNTIAAVPIGSPAANRYIFIEIGWYNNHASSPGSISGVTIGGIAATIHVIATQATNWRGGSALASALVPSGTTADVVISFSGSASAWYPNIGTYRVTGLLSNVPLQTPISFGGTISSGSMPKTWTHNVVKDGLLFANTMVDAGSSGLAGVTQDYKTNLFGSAYAIGGNQQISSDNAVYQVKLNGSSSAITAITIAAFR